MTIRLDITGFYYEIEVENNGANTVGEIMRRAAGVRAPNGGVLSAEFDSRGFVTELKVVYDGSSEPVSRQENSPFGPRRPLGTYRYADDVLSQSNRISGSGSIPGLLAWQYYVFDAEMRQKNSDRRILSTTEVPSTYSLVDGDRIVWRLIGIFGLNQFIDSKRESLVAESKGQPLSLKSAGRVLRDTNNLIPL